MENEQKLGIHELTTSFTEHIRRKAGIEGPLIYEDIYPNITDARTALLSHISDASTEKSLSHIKTTRNAIKLVLYELTWELDEHELSLPMLTVWEIHSVENRLDQIEKDRNQSQTIYDMHQDSARGSW